MRRLLFISQIILLLVFFALFNMHETKVAQLNHTILFLKIETEQLNLSADQNAKVKVLMKDINEVVEASQETKQSQLLMYGLFILMGFSTVLGRNLSRESVPEARQNELVS